MLHFNLIDDYYEGTLCSYVKLDPDAKAFDSTKYELVKSNTDPNLGYGAREWSFWFYPKYHRFIFRSACSHNQIMKFLNESFKKIYNDDTRYAINIEKDTGSIDRIFKAKVVSKLDVTLSYSNNGNEDGWDKIIDDQLRDNNVTNTDMHFKASEHNSLILTPQSMLGGILSLTKSNGTAKAHITNDKGKTEIINTELYPYVAEIKHTLENTGIVLKQLAHDIANRK